MGLGAVLAIALSMFVRDLADKMQFSAPYLWPFYRKISLRNRSKTATTTTTTKKRKEKRRLD